MEFLVKWFEAHETVSSPFWRIYGEYVQAGFDATILLLAVAILGARRIARRCKPA